MLLLILLTIIIDVALSRRYKDSQVSKVWMNFSYFFPARLDVYLSRMASNTSLWPIIITASPDSSLESSVEEIMKEWSVMMTQPQDIIIATIIIISIILLV